MTEPKSIEPTEYQLIGPSEDGEVSDLLAGKNAKEARQRMQVLISEWLRMENVVVLTGAGTSYSSGGKLMTTLEKSVLDTVASLPDISDNSAAVIAARKTPSANGETTLGFEDWLSYIVNASHLTSATGSPFSGVSWKGELVPTSKELSWLVENISKAILLDCALELKEQSGVDENVSPHLAFLAKLVARDSNLGRSHLFTLNYDTLFEQALELLGIQYFDGFTGRANARFDPSVYGLDIYWPGEIAEGRVRRFDKFLHLYKLHGSIHWHVEDGALRARHPDLAAFKNYCTSDATGKATKLAELIDHLNPVGILPTANKFAQTLTMPFSHLFRSFQIRLSAPQTFLLVLGYGFGDEHVTRVIETALMNPSLIMLVVEPDPQSATIKRVERYKQLGKRAFVLTASDEAHASKPFEQGTFDDFATNIMPDVQWLDDFLRLRKFEKQLTSSQIGKQEEQ